MADSLPPAVPLSDQLVRELRVQLYPSILAFFRRSSSCRVHEMNIASGVSVDGRSYLRIVLQVGGGKGVVRKDSQLVVSLDVSEEPC